MLGLGTAFTLIGNTAVVLRSYFTTVIAAIWERSMEQRTGAESPVTSRPKPVNTRNHNNTSTRRHEDLKMSKTSGKPENSTHGKQQGNP